MRRLLNRSLGPPEPKHFSFTHEETGHTTGPCITYDDWVEKAKEHRKAMGLPIPPNFPAIMEDQLCQTLPPEWCEYEKEGWGFWTNVKLGLHDVVTVSRALVDAAQGNYVSQEEAERRAEICSRCFLNVPLHGCGTCHALASVIAGDRTTKLDSKLNSCAVCGCVNKAQVHIHLDSMPSHANSERQMQFPSFCWQKESGENYLS